ncbi:MAG: choice-of-anchor J domain-containing protein [Candidatus Cloacimonadaceae bacterium]
MSRILKHAALVFIIWTISMGLWSAYLTDVQTALVQPDGRELNLLASGDEFHNWLHDKDGYTIIQSPQTGFYTYAEKQNGQLVAGKLIVGRDNPSSLGLEPRLNISKAEYLAKRDAFHRDEITRDTPTTGTLNNIIIYIRFSDQDEFTFNTTSQSDLYNSAAAGYVSMRNYFYEDSYQSLTVLTHLLPTQTGATIVSYQHNLPRNYFAVYNEVSNPDGLTTANEYQRISGLFSGAVAYVNTMLPAGVNFDADNDGSIDNVIFMIRGSHDGWSNFLWPHKSSIGYMGINLGGKLVNEYNLGIEYMSGVSVACHEFTHTLGAPDLYHYSDESTYSPASTWDLMDTNTNVPQHTNAYMKWKYMGWIANIPTIASNQVYTLNPLTSPTNNVYRINSPNSPDEYFVVEYRRKTGTFESSIPGSGLLVWRVNTTCGDGNADGPPDELYVYRPNGTLVFNGTPANASLSAESGRTVINDNTNPSCFLSDGSPGGINIQNVGSAGETISFYYGPLTIDFNVNPLVESLEGNAFTPFGWANVPVSGSSYFTQETTGLNPACEPYTGNAMMSFACRTIPNGNSAYFATPKIQISNQGSALYSIGFRMNRDAGYPASADRIEVYRNTVQSLSGSPVLLGTVNRSMSLSPVVTSSGWYDYSFLINPPSNGNYYIILKATSANGNNIFVDDIKLERHCLANTISPIPANDAVNIAINSALSWTNSGQLPQGMKLYFGFNNPPSSIANGIEITPSTTSWTPPRYLISNTDYYWQVIPYDQYGTAYQPQIRKFRTVAAAPLSASSYFEGFEVDDEYYLPLGWRMVNGNNDDRAWQCLLGLAYSGNKHMAISGSSQAISDDWSISRGMSLNAGYTYRLSFYYRKYGQSINAKFAVYYSGSSNPLDPKQTIYVNDNVTNIGYNYFEVDFTPATTGVHYFMFHCNSTNTAYDAAGVSIDEFLVRGIMTAAVSNPSPAVSATGVLLDTSFSWQLSSGVPTGYYISLGTNNPPTNVAHRVNVGNNLTWTPSQPLEYGKLYYWQVIPYDSMAEAVDTPVWSFYSELDAVISYLPYNENFDTTNQGAVPTNWTVFDLDGDTKKWLVYNDANAFSPPKSMRIDRSTVTSVGNDDWVITSPFKLYAGFNYQFTFKYKNMLFSYPGKMKVAYGSAPAPAQMTNVIFDNNNVNNTTWIDGVCNFTPDVTGSYFFGFHCYSVAANSGFYLYVDNVQLATTSVPLPVSAPEPADAATNVFVNNTTLSWDHTGDVYGYKISIGTDNPPTNLIEDLDLGDNKSYTYDGLWSFGTQHYWQVVPYNSVGDCATNQIYTFTAMPAAVISDFPYYEDCEALTLPALPAGYFAHNVNQDAITWLSRSTLHPASKALSMTSLDLVADDWLFLPGVSIQQGSYYVIRFRYRNDRNRSYAKLAFYRGSQPTPAAMTLNMHYNDGVMGGTFWTPIQVQFRASYTGIIYFGFHCFTFANGGRINVDNIEILRLPTPVSNPVPANEALGVSRSPAFSWTHAEGNPDGYRFYLGTDNPPTNIFNGLEIGLVNELHYLESLEFDTEYYWQVIPYNALGDAPECPRYSFVTMGQNTIIDLPYSQNFDSDEAPDIPALPYGWSYLNTNSDAAYWKTSAVAPRSAPKHVRIAPAVMVWDYNDWMFMPPIYFVKGLQYRLTFYVRQTGTRVTDYLQVWYGDRKTVAGMTNQILSTTVNSSADASYTMRQVSFTPTQTGARYIGFLAITMTDPGIINIDDVTVQQMTSSFQPPRNLAAVSTSASIALNWLAPVSGTVSQYKLFRNGYLIATLPASPRTYTDTNVLYGVTYQYYLTATYAAPVGESVTSNHIYTSLLPAVPLAPAGLSLVVSQNSVNLSWQPVVLDEMGNPITVNSYKVYASDLPDFIPGPENLMETTPLTTFTESPVQSRRFYRIIAVKEP